MIKMTFLAFFIKLIWLGVDFLNRNDTEIGYRVKVLKKQVLSIFLNSKNTASAQLWPTPYIVAYSIK